jgi:hypothetical protein
LEDRRTIGRSDQVAAMVSDDPTAKYVARLRLGHSHQRCICQQGLVIAAGKFNDDVLNGFLKGRVPDQANIEVTGLPQPVCLADDHYGMLLERRDNPSDGIRRYSFSPTRLRTFPKESEGSKYQAFAERLVPACLASPHSYLMNIAVTCGEILPRLPTGNV